MVPHYCYPAVLLLSLLCPSARMGETQIGTKAHPESTLTAQKIVPQKGVFLVSRPAMADRRFRRAVILLLSHDREGSLGVILNRPTGVSVSKLFPNSDDSQTLFYGGPVGLDGVMFLTRNAEPLEGATRVMNDIYFGGNRTTLERLLGARKTAAELRIYVGYAGWSPGQLATEIEGGAWRLVRGDPHTVFAKDAETIWQDMMDHLQKDRSVVWKTGGLDTRPISDHHGPLGLLMSRMRRTGQSSRPPQ